jgi:hypothetical protein
MHMESNGVDTSYQTRAFGRIAEDAGFTLSPFFDFFGEVRVEANSKEHTFSGSTRIQHGCSGLDRDWMGFTGRIDPVEVMIPVSDTLLDENGDPIGTGLFLTQDDPFQLYGTFLSRKRDGGDATIAAARGLLFFDKAKKEYVIGNREKLRQRNLPGDLVSLKTETCDILADGRIGTGLNLGRVELINVGTVKHVPDRSETHAELVMMTNFLFHDNALERMADQIMSYPEQKQVDITKTNFERSLREMLGLERSDKLISELSLKGEIRKLPDELVKSFSLCDVKLKWDGPEQAWLSEGPIGIGTILKKPIFRYVKGKVVLERKRSGDILTVLLMLDDQTWYFFQYTRGRMLAASSDKEYNTMLQELDEKKRTAESKKDLPDYSFIWSGDQKVKQFRDRFDL